MSVYIVAAGWESNSKHSVSGVLFALIELIMENLKINGIEKRFSDGIPQTLAELLKILDINQTTIVAEIDGKIIAAENFGQTQLFSGQSIELILFVGGG